MSAPTTSSVLLEAALDYARRGIPVVPLWPLTDDNGCSCPDGANCRTPGKHPRIKGWEDHGSVVPKTIRAWWTATPTAGIGSPTGRRSGAAVLDVDPRNGGLETLARLEAEHGPLPGTPRLRSGSGGPHYRFKHPGDQPYKKATLGPGVELLLDGQQSVLPPSRNANGAYAWEVSLDEAELAPLPGWVVPLLEPKPEETAEQKAERRRRRTRPGTPPTRRRSGLPLGDEARRFFREGAPLKSEDVDKTQRDALIAAVVNAWGDTGLMLSPEAITEMAWQGISRSPVGDEGWPWTREDVEEIVDDVLSREAAPLEELGSVRLNGHHVGRRHASADDRRHAEAPHEPPADGPPPSPDGHQPDEPAPSDRPEIDAGEGDLPKVTNAAWAAVAAANDPPRLFRHGGGLARIESDDDGAPIIRELTPDRLRYALGRTVHWTRTEVNRRTGEVVTKDVLPPVHVAKDMLATPNPQLPVLTRIIEAPVFGPNGELQTTPGYHASSRSFYMPEPGFELPPVSEDPSEAEIGCALTLVLDDLLGDFSFVSAADRAIAVEGFLAPAARELIAGPTPLRMVEAPGPGSGKGLLVDAVTYPSAGRHLGTVTQAEDDAEWRKKITAALRRGAGVVLLDNLTAALDSGALASALTTTSWEDRVLGTNDLIKIPVRCAWFATGNNPTMSTEIARRTVRVRLDPKIDRPWRRDLSDFRHPNLRLWVEENRADLVWAALTLIQAWVAKGKPLYEGKPLGSYERWSAVMGGILEVVGVEGFLGNLDEFYEAVDLETGIWREFVGAWWAKHNNTEVGPAELFPLAKAIDGFDLGTGNNERSQRITFGKHLSKQRDRVIGTYRVTPTRTVQRAQKWRLLPTDTESLLL